MERETVIILDSSGQYGQLIARRVRELNVYCEVMPYNASKEKILAKKPKAIIISGDPLDSKKASIFNELDLECYISP